LGLESFRGFLCFFLFFFEFFPNSSEKFRICYILTVIDKIRKDYRKYVQIFDVNNENIALNSYTNEYNDFLENNIIEESRLDPLQDSFSETYKHL
jgi:hypothetical protein